MDKAVKWKEAAQQGRGKDSAWKEETVGIGIFNIGQS